jgi:HSP20 family molecular chaperone IbpA
MRLEDYIDDGHYVIRAELPGLDPGKQGILEVRVGLKRTQRVAGRQIPVKPVAELKKAS